MSEWPIGMLLALGVVVATVAALALLGIIASHPCKGYHWTAPARNEPLLVCDR